MKTPSTELFDLVRSLTKQEKRYYKMYTTLSGGKTNKYLMLFDAIDAQKEYDEEVITMLITCHTRALDPLSISPGDWQCA